jgi:thiamine-monophosphate kinase
MEELAAQTGTTIAGGDLSEGATLVIAVSVAGRLEEETSALTRDGARPGDCLVVSGPLGASEAGRAVIEHPASMQGLPEEIWAALLRAHQCPKPEFAAARAIRALGPTALMDCSDGLMIDGSRMAEASRCGLVVDLEAVPRADGVDPVAVALGMEPDVFAATSGEDYRLLAAVHRDAVPDALQALPGGAVVGTFTKGARAMARRNGVPVALATSGYTHDV